MNPTANISNLGPEKDAREHLKLLFARYLAEQPESTRATHRWMKRLEAAGMGIVCAAFIIALGVSILWKSVNPLAIPVAWFVFAASFAPALIFSGLDAIFLRATPPSSLTGKTPIFVTGSGAVWIGIGMILLALVLAAFWSFFAYVTITQNWAMLAPMISALGAVLGIGMTISILVAMAQKVFKSR